MYLLTRYRDKIHYIVDNISNLPLVPKNDLEKRGIFYSLQTSIEAMVDIVAMLVKDIGTIVKDDRENIKNLTQRRNIPAELGEKLLKANGLRNILVHRYNGVDEQIILNSIQEITELLFKWLDIVEGILNQITNN